MPDLFQNVRLLRSTGLELEELSLCGVRYGCSANEFPVERVSEVTLAPIVQSSAWSTEVGSSYLDANGRKLSLSEVVENAMQCGGILHFRENVSFRFRDGQVDALALYGTSLLIFRYIESYPHFVKEFGAAESVVRKEAFGDLMGYRHYYSHSKKLVEWDDMGKKVVVINFA
jgi:hypothetical protein